MSPSPFDISGPSILGKELSQTSGRVHRSPENMWVVQPIPENNNEAVSWLKKHRAVSEVEKISINYDGKPVSVYKVTKEEIDILNKKLKACFVGYRKEIKKEVTPWLLIHTIGLGKTVLQKRWNDLTFPKKK